MTFICLEKNKMTIEKELNKVLENISLIQTSQSEVKFPVDDLGDFADYLSDYIPNHVDWLKKGNEKFVSPNEWTGNSPIAIIKPIFLFMALLI